MRMPLYIHSCHIIGSPLMRSIYHIEMHLGLYDPAYLCPDLSGGIDSNGADCVVIALCRYQWDRFNKFLFYKYQTWCL